MIVAGETPPNPSELLESHRMGELLEHWARLTTSSSSTRRPVSVVADAMPLVRHVDGVIVVSWIGTARATAHYTFGTNWRASSAPTLGVVINRLKAGSDGYYGYGTEPVDLSAFERVS